MSHFQALYGVVQYLLIQGAITLVLSLEIFQELYSNLFTVLKKEGVNLILDLMTLNCFVGVQYSRWNPSVWWWPPFIRGMCSYLCWVPTRFTLFSASFWPGLCSLVFTELGYLDDILLRAETLC